MAANERLIRGSISIFYLLIGLEIVIMISPFAAYFYSVYGPFLNFLYDYKMTAWLTGFFLPHAVVSKSSLLNFLGAFGKTIFSLGIIAFLVGAFQIYSAKFRRKGAVTSLLYGRIRHPQYLFLGIAGLGLLLFWPRFLILVSYISMLFVYYLLARHEEQRMLAQHGENYLPYMEKTAMFLPGEPGGKMYRMIFRRTRPTGVALAVNYGIALVLAVSAALGLRLYTISKASILYLPREKIVAVSILPRSDQYLKEVLSVASGDRNVSNILKDFHHAGHQGFLLHMMPKKYRMQGLFVRPFGESEGRTVSAFSWKNIFGFVFRFLRPPSHQSMMGKMNDGEVRLIFSQLTWPNGQYASPNDALDFGVKHLPLLEVDINLANHAVQRVKKTPQRNLWGQMPMPAF
jgi:protein-S-isoprenylcysteine O-methyltransferase Ste14